MCRYNTGASLQLGVCFLGLNYSRRYMLSDLQKTTFKSTRKSGPLENTYKGGSRLLHSIFVLFFKFFKF